MDNEASNNMASAGYRIVITLDINADRRTHAHSEECSFSVIIILACDTKLGRNS